MFKQFPNIVIDNTKKNQGIYRKSIMLTKGFLGDSPNSLFLSNKNMNLSAPLFQNSKRKTNGYLLEILFHGLNYSSKRIKLYRKPFLIDVHRSEIFHCRENIKTTVKSRIYKRRLVFFSYDKASITNVENYIKNMKKPNSYTGKGLFNRTDVYKIKKKKKKKKR